VTDGATRGSSGTAVSGQHQFATRIWIPGCVALVYLGASAAMSSDPSYVLLAALVLVSAAIDWRNPFAMKNIFLIYTLMFFAFAGAHFYPGDNQLLADMLLYLAAFCIGNVVGNVGRRASAPRALLPAAAPRFPVAKRLVLASIGVSMLALVGEVLYEGAGAFYSGQLLAARIALYASGNAISTVLAVVDTVSSTLTVAAAIICVAAAKRDNYRFPTLLLLLGLVVAPALRLDRSATLFGGLFMIAALRFNVGSRPRFKRRQAVLMSAVLVVLIGAVALIGAIRGDQLTGQRTDGLSVVSLQDQLLSELSPITLYHNVERDIGSLGYQYGRTIGPPLATQFLPRTLFPGKPDNTSAFYDARYTPSAFAAGYSIAPSIFGDLYLNGGLIAVCAGCVILGAIAGRLDRLYDLGKAAVLPSYLLVYYFIYSILRDDLSISLAFLILTSAAYAVLTKILPSRGAHFDKPPRAVEG
jgi:oligosaccharide repeat unit polymerase